MRCYGRSRPMTQLRPYSAGMAAAVRQTLSIGGVDRYSIRGYNPGLMRLPYTSEVSG